MLNQITLAFLVYIIIAFRFFVVFRTYELKALSVPGLYNKELTSSLLFKVITITRTIIVSFCAPIVSIFFPSYISVFFHGIELKVIA